MLQRWHTLNYAITLVTALSLTTMVPAQAQTTVPPPEPVGDAGYFIQYGGTVKRKIAKTQTAGHALR